MFYGGLMYKYHFNNGDSPIHLLAGFDIKTWDYLNYNLGTKMAVGVGYGSGRLTRVALVFESYTGNIPYGLNEIRPRVYTNPKVTIPAEEWGGKVKWYGLGLYVNPTF